MLTIHTPLISLAKHEIILRGLELGLDYGLTSSCYDPSLEGIASGSPPPSETTPPASGCPVYAVRSQATDITAAKKSATGHRIMSLSIRYSVRT